MYPHIQYFNGVPEYVGQIRYQPTYWNDLRAPATVGQPGGSNDPTFQKMIDNGAGSRGIYAWVFRPTDQRQLFYWLQVPHGWKEGGIVKPHFHWAPDTANAGNVLWGMEFCFATPAGTFPNTTLSTVVAATELTALKHQIAILADITLTGAKISTMIGFRAFRDGASGSDTYLDDAYLLEIDFHYRTDTPGSRQEYQK